jgi:hypothetical protein
VLGFLCSEFDVCGTLVSNVTLKQRTAQATAKQSVARTKTSFIQIINIIYYSVLTLCSNAKTENITAENLILDII